MTRAQEIEQAARSCLETFKVIAPEYLGIGNTWADWSYVANTVRQVEAALALPPDEGKLETTALMRKDLLVEAHRIIDYDSLAGLAHRALAERAIQLVSDIDTLLARSDRDGVIAEPAADTRSDNPETWTDVTVWAEEGGVKVLAEPEPGHICFTVEHPFGLNTFTLARYRWNRVVAACALRTAPAQDERGKIVAEVAAERQRQISVEGWTPDHDDKHADGELARAAGAYCESAAQPKLLKRVPGAAFALPRLWPREWSLDWWKPKNPRTDLIRAAALIVAEVERLDRRGDHLKEPT